MEDKKIKEIFFNTIPHSIREDFCDPHNNFGVPEKNILLHLRMVADMFGYVYTTADQLRSDVFGNKIKRSTVNDHLLSLRKQGYIAYVNRKGNGGSFQIKIDKWLVEKGVWTSIHAQKIENKNGGAVLGTPRTTPEAATEVAVQKRRSDGLKHVDFQSRMAEIVLTRNGGTYNDKEKEIDKNYVRSSIKKVMVQEFEPKSDVDGKLKRIAESVGEEDMGFVFWVYGQKREDGVWEMERLATDLLDKPGVIDKRAYFNSEVRRRLNLK